MIGPSRPIQGDTHRVLIPSEPKPKPKRKLTGVGRCPQRGYLMWMKKEGITARTDNDLDLLRAGRRGRERNRGKKRKGRVWWEGRVSLRGRLLPKVSVSDSDGSDRVVMLNIILCVAIKAHGQKLHGTSSYPPSLDSRLERPPKWYEKLLGIGQGKYPVEQQIENKRRGLGKQQRPFACWVLTLGELSILGCELWRRG